MVDTDYEDASLDFVRPNPKRRGAKYGKRAARATARPSRAPGRGDEPEVAKKREWALEEAVNERGGDDDADAGSESAGEEQLEVRFGLDPGDARSLFSRFK